ncbi:hypothetical protein MMC13_000252 [Lambiella insularis]|nr:hypothetical protein [Lambiella insularis]
MREGDNEGTTTPHGLLVRLPGQKLSFPNRPKGLPGNPWNIITDETMLYTRDENAAWYLVRRRWPNSKGDYLSDMKLGDLIRSDADLWITYLETDFQARSDGVQQTSTALLVMLVQEEDDTKYVQSYMHLHVKLLQKTSQGMFECAYQCAQQLAESEPVRQLANMSDNEVNMEFPAYKAIFDALQPETSRIAASGENEAALATARQTSGKDKSVLFGAIMGMMFIGHYALMGPKLPDTQEWCVVD